MALSVIFLDLDQVVDLLLGQAPAPQLELGDLHQRSRSAPSCERDQQLLLRDQQVRAVDLGQVVAGLDLHAREVDEQLLGVAVHAGRDRRKRGLVVLDLADGPQVAGQFPVGHRRRLHAGHRQGVVGKRQAWAAPPEPVCAAARRDERHLADRALARAVQTHLRVHRARVDLLGLPRRRRLRRAPLTGRWDQRPRKIPGPKGDEQRTRRRRR